VNIRSFSSVREVLPSFSPMRDHVFIRGESLVPVTREPGSLDQLVEMSGKVINDLISQSGVAVEDVSMLIVGNMLSPILQRQSQLASYIASKSNLVHGNRGGGTGIDTLTLDAACGSGGQALRAGLMAILSGFHENVIVLGVESMIDQDKNLVTRGLAQASDWKEEGGKGATFVSLNDSMMTAYIETYQNSIDPDDFYYFSKNAHKNALTASHSVMKKDIDINDYKSSMLLGKNVKLYDACPTCNGCAGVLLSRKGVIGQDPIVSGSDSRIDNIHLKSRENLLAMEALKTSVDSALAQAEITRDQVSIYEAHDAYSIMAALSLEVCGFVAPGGALKFAKNGNIGLGSQLPISTFGGLKARGHPVGASGVYQIVEAVTQLKGSAGENQVKNVKNVLCSSFGGAATTVASNVLTI